MIDDANIYIKLSDVASVAAGYPLRGSAEALKLGDVQFLQLKNMSMHGGVDWEDVASVTLPSKKEPVWLRDGDVIFSARGTRTLAYSFPKVPQRTVCAPQFFVLSVRKPDLLLPEFLAWQINQKPAQDYLQRNATGSHIQNIRRGILELMPIAVPPQKTQATIVSFWRAAQREQLLLNELIQTRNTQLEALAIGLAHSKSEARL